MEYEIVIKGTFMGILVATIVVITICWLTGIIKRNGGLYGAIGKPVLMLVALLVAKWYLVVIFFCVGFSTATWYMLNQ